MTGPEDHQQRPTTINAQFNPTLNDIRAVRMLLRNFVPTELADMILHQAEYYHVISDYLRRPLAIYDTRTRKADIPILSVLLQSEDEARSILHASLVIVGHDQGRSDFPQDRGTTNNSWTWYSIGTGDPKTHEQRLATNLHAVWDPQTHSFEWNKDSDIVRQLREEWILEVWAHARYVWSL